VLGRHARLTLGGLPRVVLQLKRRSSRLAAGGSSSVAVARSGAFSLDAVADEFDRKRGVADAAATDEREARAALAVAKAAKAEAALGGTNDDDGDDAATAAAAVAAAEAVCEAATSWAAMAAAEAGVVKKTITLTAAKGGGRGRSRGSEVGNEGGHGDDDDDDDDDDNDDDNDGDEGVSGSPVMLVTLAIHFSGRDGAPSSSSSNYSSTPAAISAEDGPSAYYLSRVSEGGAGLVGNDNADDDDEFGDVDDNRGGGGGGHRAKGGGRGGFGREKGDVSSPLELPAGCPVLENRAPDFGGDEYLPNEVEVVVVASRGLRNTAPAAAAAKSLRSLSGLGARSKGNGSKKKGATSYVKVSVGRKHAKSPASHTVSVDADAARGGGGGGGASQRRPGQAQQPYHFRAALAAPDVAASLTLRIFGSGEGGKKIVSVAGCWFFLTPSISKLLLLWVLSS
jgi:hypothetical protein